MPLVPMNIVSEWYSRDSLVYRNFAFLFQNPLWNRNVPKGFSLCPYFWLAVFSFLIFRPFAYAVYGFGRAVMALRLGRVVKWTDSLVNRLAGSDCDTPLIPTFLGVSLVGLIVTVGFGLTQAIIAYLAAGVIFALILPAILLAVLLTCGIYTSNRGSSQRCPVEVYSRITTVLCVIAAFALYPSYAWQSFVGYPILIITGTCGVIAFCAVGIWGGIVWLGHWIVAATIGIVPFLPVAIVLLVLAAIYGYVAMRMMGKAVGDASKRPADKSDSICGKQYHHTLNYIARTLAEIQWEQGGRNLSSYDTWKAFVPTLASVRELARRISYDDIGVSDIRPIADEAIAQMVAYQDKRLARQAAWDARCCAITSVLVKVCAPVTAVWKQVRIFCSMLWQVAKARKNGACPYLTFTDPK